jgi:sulfate adenylyltransferase subunit 2
MHARKQKIFLLLKEPIVRQIAPETALAESFVSLSRDTHVSKPDVFADRKALTPHLRRLEAEAIFIMREVVAEFARPVMLYSVGKDSSVMLHLARKAFFPSRPPFPFLHIASGWDFRAVLEHRDHTARTTGLELIVHTNEEAAAAGVNPFDTPTGEYSRVMLTEALKAALDAHGFDAALGGGRRDEEKSRAKERVFSHRSADHVWDPRNQRPELWRVFNTRIARGESMRVFPLSNWTEFDVWDYLRAENIPIVPLYLAAERPIVRRDGALVMVDDPARARFRPAETIERRQVRFRTLGCWPLTGAVESSAASVDDIIAELRASPLSERQGRLVDAADHASMERKKREGYF